MPYLVSSIKLKGCFLALGLLTARSMQPLALVDDQNFRDWIFHVDPRLSIPCRNTMTHTILPQLFRYAYLLKNFMFFSRYVLDCILFHFLFFPFREAKGKLLTELARAPESNMSP
jgi:hypothetical protein